MTIENPFNVDIPTQVSEFDQWMIVYVRDHGLTWSGISRAEYEKNHKAAFVAKAKELGLTLHDDGTLTIDEPQ